MSGPAQDTGVLAQLMAQAAREGADLATMRGIAEEAGELSAMRALTRLGLSNEAARGDLAELRELLGAWRDAKRSAWKAASGSWSAAPGTVPWRSVMPRMMLSIRLLALSLV